MRLSLNNDADTPVRTLYEKCRVCQTVERLMQ